MSMFYDIKRVFQKANGIFGLEKEKCAELFLEVLGALEWDTEDWFTVDYNDPEWETKAKVAAIKFLFPDD